MSRSKNLRIVNPRRDGFPWPWRCSGPRARGPSAWAREGSLLKKAVRSKSSRRLLLLGGRGKFGSVVDRLSSAASSTLTTTIALWRRSPFSSCLQSHGRWRPGGPSHRSAHTGGTSSIRVGDPIRTFFWRRKTIMARECYTRLSKKTHKA
jgi:hypothetical protein